MMLTENELMQLTPWNLHGNCIRGRPKRFEIGPFLTTFMTSRIISRIES